MNQPEQDFVENTSTNSKSNNNVNSPNQSDFTFLMASGLLVISTTLVIGYLISKIRVKKFS